MPKTKSYYFLVDNATEEKAILARKALASVDVIDEILWNVRSGLLEVKAVRPVKTEVEMALSIAKLVLRREVTKNEL
jgi:hypothetical protein